MKSILEWGKEMDCYLCRHGQRPAELTLDTTLEKIATPTLTATVKRKLHQHNTLLIGEIIQDDNIKRSWSLPQQLRWLRNKLPNQPPKDRRVLL